MLIREEKKFYATAEDCDGEIVGVVQLDDGTLLIVFPDGTATGCDGKTYVHVGRSIPDPDDPDDEILETVGWTTDAEKPVIL